MKKIRLLSLLLFCLIFITSCALDIENVANMPEIDSFKVNKIYRLNRNVLASYIDKSGNQLILKLGESSATWKRIMFKTKVIFNH